MIRIDGLSIVDTVFAMETKIARWGNSLALRIPKKWATGQQLFEDSPVELIEQADGLLLRPSRKKTYDLDKLLSGVTKENLHPEVSSAEARGREAW